MNSNADNKRILAKNLKKYMQLSGKNRHEICQALGFNYSTFTEWVVGRKYPRIDKIEKLADYFGIQKSDLIEEASSPEKSVENTVGLTKRKILAKNLSYYLARSGYTSKDLSAEIGVPYTTMLSWLKAQNYPRISKIESLAKCFDIQISDLIEEKTFEDKKSKDALASILARIVKDDEFFCLVSSMHNLDADKLDSVKQVLQALHAFGK